MDEEQQETQNLLAPRPARKHLMQRKIFCKQLYLSINAYYSCNQDH